MTTKISVTFDMVFDTVGECKTELRFALTEHPDAGCPDSVKRLVIGEIKTLCGALLAAPPELFSKGE